MLLRHGLMLSLLILVGLTGLTCTSTEPPPTPHGLKLLVSSDLGRRQDDLITSDATPTLTLKAAPNTLVRLFSDERLVAQAQATDPLELTPRRLPNGTHRLTATAQDQQGNISPASAPLHVIIDTQAPASPSGIRLIDDRPSGGLAATGVTRHVTFTLSGEAEPAAIVRVFDGEQQVAEQTAAPAWQVQVGPLSDGQHRITAVAEDVAGNVSAPSEALLITIDTAAPVITLNSPSENTTLHGNERLSGAVADGPIQSLFYQFDTGNPIGVPLDPATGAFDTQLNISGLANGSHILTLTAIDRVGHRTQTKVEIDLDFAVPLALTDYTPLHGAYDVGVTFRPRIAFSTAVDPQTLNDTSFFISAGAQKLPATIVTGQDGRLAWLFLTQPMPGGATLQVTVNGDLIRPLGSGSALDADGDGEPGGVRTYRFTTVSRMPLAGTTLSGIVVDPGPDQQPMTVDDVDPGADGKLHTADDRFLLPITGVQVFLLGLEDQGVRTDAEGRFTLDDVPGGNVKVAIDGTTATSAPEGFYFPEMVMDAHMAAGADNPVMPGMRTVYLPRLPQAILRPVDASETTMIVADDVSAPGLPAPQRQWLQIEIQPNSLVAADGRALDAGQVGISTVPPELVRDMLPPGVLQHTFDITVQAPGVSTFSVPAPMTFPNVFQAPPGSQLNFLSFDHTTGRLVIEGTATVSADGASVTTDPNTGITHPGWHGVTPPGTETQPACDPTVEADVEVEPIPVIGELGSVLPLKDHLFVKDTDQFTWIFRNDAGKLEVNGKVCSPKNQKATPLVIELEVSGPADKFLYNVKTQTFELPPGAKQQVVVRAKELLGKIKTINRDRLYGAKVKVKARKKGVKKLLVPEKEVFIYRFLDAVDDKHTDGTLEFAKSLVDGKGKVTRTRSISFSSFPLDRDLAALPNEYSAFKIAGPNAAAFSLQPLRQVGLIDVVFDPKAVGQQNASWQLITPNKTVLALKLRGQGAPKNKIFFDKEGLRAQLKGIAKGKIGTWPDANGVQVPAVNANVTKAEKALFDTPKERQDIATQAEAAFVKKFAEFKAGLSVTQKDIGDHITYVAWYNGVGGIFGTSAPGKYVQGGLPRPNEGIDHFLTIDKLIKNLKQHSKAVRNFLLAQALNRKWDDEVLVIPDNILEFQTDGMKDFISPQLVQALAKTAAHEVGHTLGAMHVAQRQARDEVQKMELTGGAAADTFQLRYKGQTTAKIARSAKAVDIRNALVALPPIGPGQVAAKGKVGGPFDIIFFGELGSTNVPQLQSVGATGTLKVKISTSKEGDNASRIVQNLVKGKGKDKVKGIDEWHFLKLPVPFLAVFALVGVVL